MESLLDPFSGSRFVTTCHPGAFFPSSFPYSSTFKATIISLVWRSEPLSLIISGVQSHYLSIFWRSKPSLHNCGIQSRCSHSSVWYSKPLVSLAFRFVHSLAFKAIGQLGIQAIGQFGVQSHSLSAFQAFKATISPQFGVQSHLFTIVAFRVLVLIHGLEFRAIGQFGV